MILTDVMDELGTQLETIDGLRVYRYPPDNVQVPAAVLDLPSSIQFDQTYGRGMDRLTLALDVLVGRVHDRSTRGLILPYFDGSGDRSIKQVTEAGTYTAFDSIRVDAADDPFAVWTFAAVEYLAGSFTLDIAGAGTQ